MSCVYIKREEEFLSLLCHLYYLGPSRVNLYAQAVVTEARAWPLISRRQIALYFSEGMFLPLINLIFPYQCTRVSGELGCMQRFEQLCQLFIKNKWGSLITWEYGNGGGVGFVCFVFFRNALYSLFAVYKNQTSKSELISWQRKWLK